MEVEDVDGIESDETRDNIMSEAIKLMEIPASHDLEIVDEKSEMVEKNSIEEKVENVESETEESNEFQAELIPTSFNDLDASIASSDVDSNSASYPQKISISVLDPIIEMPNEDQLQMSEIPRIIRKRNPRNRFLFKADAL